MTKNIWISHSNYTTDYVYDKLWIKHNDDEICSVEEVRIVKYTTTQKEYTIFYHKSRPIDAPHDNYVFLVTMYNEQYEMDLENVIKKYDLYNINNIEIINNITDLYKL